MDKGLLTLRFEMQPENPDWDPEVIASFSCTCIPFAEGDIIHLMVKDNSVGCLWSINAVLGDFKVEKIKTFFSCDYPHSIQKGPSEYIDVIVRVTKVE